MRTKIAAVTVFFAAVIGASLAFLPAESSQVHSHAKFAVILDGQVVDMSSRQFQLNSRKVHLESGKSHIVHKHSAGVTWSEFLGTLPVKVRHPDASDICVAVRRREVCGKGAVILNGEKAGNLSQVIEQGDTLVIAAGMENYMSQARKFYETPLPAAYRPFWLDGRMI